MNYIKKRKLMVESYLRFMKYYKEKDLELCTKIKIYETKTLPKYQNQINSLMLENNKLRNENQEKDKKIDNLQLKHNEEIEHINLKHKKNRTC